MQLNDKNEAIDLALILRQQHNTQDPFVIAKAMNIKIIYVDVDLSVMRGYSYYYSEDKMEMKINSNLSKKQQEYVCAHEIGHLRAKHKGKSNFKDKDLDREYYADLFAVSLLYLYNRFKCRKDILDLSSYALKTILETGWKR